MYRPTEGLYGLPAVAHVSQNVLIFTTLTANFGLHLEVFRVFFR
jgi:hypothetical protein